MRPGACVERPCKHLKDFGYWVDRVEGVVSCQWCDQVWDYEAYAFSRPEFVHPAPLRHIRPDVPTRSPL